MSLNMLKKVAVFFGGKSPEHEISIISGIQVMNALDKNKYQVIPVYITKEGRWIRGNKSFLMPETFNDLGKIALNGKRVYLSMDPDNKGLVTESTSLLNSNKNESVDVIFPVFHGRYGEDGSIQGIFEMSGIPYVGCDVMTSAIGMDKIISKQVAKSINIPVLNDCVVTQSSWKEKKSDILKKICDIGFPLFIKPSRLGSSIGVTRANNIEELQNAVEVAFFYDSRVLIEKGLDNAKEVNISILGNDPYELSICEMPVTTNKILSFEDKYINKGKKTRGMASAQRIIPAPIKESTKKIIENYAIDFFSEIGGQGISRLDFLLSQDENKIYFNEINTMPGSVAFYLWKKVGVSFDRLVDNLIDLSLDRHNKKQKLTTTFKSNVLAGFSGTKGVKD